MHCARPGLDDAHATARVLPARPLRSATAGLATSCSRDKSWPIKKALKLTSTTRGHMKILYTANEHHDAQLESCATLAAQEK